MANTWGGTAIPLPTKYDRRPELVGAQYVLADGSLRTDSITSKAVIDLEFSGITAAERTTLLGKFTTYSSASLAIQDESAENVIPVANSCNVSRIPGGAEIYTVSGQVRTV